MATLYRVNEFADRAGVTVRTLHHYDRLGLLKPSSRSGAGYRLYSERDFARLQQIVTLKFIGLPLKQIRELLTARTFSLKTALQIQLEMVREKRRRMDLAVHAMERAERELADEGEPDWQAFRKIVEVIEMQNDTDWTKKYYSPEAQAKVESRKNLWSPELQERVSKEWADLVRDIEAAMSEDPASPKAQALAARWSKLVGEFTGGDPQIGAGLKKMWGDRQNWPADIQQKSSPITPEVMAFIAKAMAAKK